MTTETSDAPQTGRTNTEPDPGGPDEEPVCANCGGVIGVDDLVCPHCGISLVTG